jgi:uncharacterized integral membrane protein
MPDDEIQEHSGAVHRHDAVVILRWVVAAAFVVALLLVGLDNRDKVRIGYVTGEAHAPIWIVVVGSAIAGMVIGLLLKRDRRR